MSETDATKETMTLVDACPPALPAATYQVHVKQSVMHEEKEISGKASGRPTFEKTSTFSVSAPRLTLTPSEFYAMYPPADAQGRFSEVFPHVVLSRRTLPWERTLQGADSKSPWMALLLLDEVELGLNTEDERKLQSRAVKTVKDISSAEKVSGQLVVPNLQPEPWQRDDDPCLTLDIPLELFRAIAPSWEDLPYLAHARRVGNTTHMEADGIEDGGWFSVVVGNRLPTPNKENRVFLVSLEGLEGNLPRQNSPPASADLKGTIRLVVLASWRFVDHTEGKGFRELVRGLKCGPLRLLFDTGAATSEADKDVKTWLEFGYAPLAHQTREGYHTVSWYRGPFVPHFLPTEPKNVVYSCADAALRYDRYKGFFDVSYAAAWQLGRLLGLQNQPFARAVCRLKLRAAQRAAEAAAKKALAQRFGAEPASHWEEVAKRFFNEASLSKADPQPPAGTSPGGGSPAKVPDHSDALRKELEKQGKQLELPLEMRQWLGRLFLLHGVPLAYLVPHPQMLDQESLRFFYVDTSWIGALLDGALSIGRTSESQLLLDKVMAGHFLKNVALGEVGVDLTTNTDLGNPDGKEIVGHITGFLLRSELVSGWRGLEIRAGDGTKPLTALRMRRVAKDTMLAIYNGQIRELVITQPPQGLHFGAPEGASDAVWRGTKRVLKVRDLARIQGQEGKPAQFAGRMLQKRVKQTIEIDRKVG